MRFAIWTFVPVLFAASAAHADVVTLTSVRDGTLFQDANGAVANGSGPVLFVGRAGSTSTTPVRRALVRFDVAAALPAGSTVNSAQLVLVNPSGNTGPRNVELHLVLADWSEGASSTSSGPGAPSQPGDATWIHRSYPSVFWAAASGDFDPLASASLVVDPLGTHTWPSTARAVADVQGWLDAPASNFGWLLKLDVESVSNTTKVFGSRESTTPGERPALVIDFTPPPFSTYCTASTSALGCVPAIGATGIPSASAGSGFVVTLANAVNQKSVLLAYGTSGPATQPFLGALLCVAPPLKRTPFSSTGGSLGFNDCSGASALDFNARIASGVDPALAAGVVVHAQWLARDPFNPLGSFSSSDGLRFTIAP